MADGGWEVSVGTDVPHAREIGEGKTPYIKMHGHDLSFMLESVDNGLLSGTGAVGVNLTTNTDQSGALNLVRAVLPYTDQLKRAVSIVDGRFGKGHVIEYRILKPSKIYPKLRDALEVYDADLRLGNGAVATLSGYRPSQTYLTEMAAQRE